MSASGILNPNACMRSPHCQKARAIMRARTAHGRAHLNTQIARTQSEAPAQLPSRSRRLHNVTAETLRFAVVTSVADDDSIEFCYATLGFYTRRMAVPARDIFVFDATKLRAVPFASCFSAFNVTVLAKSLHDAYANVMQTSDTAKRGWYGILQTSLFKQGYHFTFFVDIDEWLVSQPHYGSRLAAMDDHRCPLWCTDASAAALPSAVGLHARPKHARVSSPSSGAEGI
jgi:hypothetical protein